MVCVKTNEEDFEAVVGINPCKQSVMRSFSNFKQLLAPAAESGYGFVPIRGFWNETASITSEQVQKQNALKNSVSFSFLDASSRKEWWERFMPQNCLAFRCNQQ